MLWVFDHDPVARRARAVPSPAAAAFLELLDSELQNRT
jgi:hypothetical protein